MCVLDEQVDEGVVHGGTEMALECLLLLLCARLVESLEMNVIRGVGFHVGQGGRQREGVRLGLVGEFLERGEEMEERGGVLTEGFGGYGGILEQRGDLGGNLTWRAECGRKKGHERRTLVSVQQRYAWASASSKFSSSDLTFLARICFLNSCRSVGVLGGFPSC